MNPNLLLAFWVAAFVLIVVPGPDWAFVLASGARDRVVLPAVGGLVIGYSLLTAIVAAGLGTLVAHSSTVLTALTGIGAGYLAYLGVTLLRRPGAPHPGHSPAVTSVSASSRVLGGIGVSGLNPKGLLIFLALLPQFTDAHGSWPVQIQLATLGLVFVATCAGFYTVIGFGARAMLSTRPAAARLISRVSGTAMITVGLILIVERIHQLAG